jgi:acid phosphatase class B
MVDVRNIALSAKKLVLGVDKTNFLWYNKDMKNNNNIKTKAFVFDFDDTLATTAARVVVLEHGQFSHSISAAEYNTHKLNANESYYFGEFKNPEFIVNGKPLGLIELAKAVHAEGHSLYILTARTEATSNAIATFLARFNITAKMIHCVGKDSATNIAKAKQSVLMTIIDNHDITYFYDDDEANIELASSLECKTYSQNC